MKFCLVQYKNLYMPSFSKQFDINQKYRNIEFNHCNLDLFSPIYLPLFCNIIHEISKKKKVSDDIKAVKLVMLTEL